jgi:hypothetical protein
LQASGGEPARHFGKDSRPVGDGQDDPPRFLSQARAAKAPGVALAEAGERRIRQVVASQVAPMPTIDIIRVEDPATPGHGFVLIAVARSPTRSCT